MATNGRGSMRANGRSPPFLAIGLFIALVILGFNYWSLSKHSSEQANEIALFESELKLAKVKKTSAEKHSESLSLTVKNIEGLVVNLKREINTHKETINTKKNLIEVLQRDKTTLENKFNLMTQELDKMNRETLPALKREKAKKIQELGDVQDRLSELQKQQTQCDESKCMVYIKSSRDKLLDDIFKLTGAATFSKLKKAGVDVGQFAAKLIELPSAEPQNSTTPNPKNELNRMGTQQNETKIIPYQSENVQMIKPGEPPSSAANPKMELNQLLTQQNETTSKKIINFQSDVQKIDTTSIDMLANNYETLDKQFENLYGQEKSKQEISYVNIEDDKNNENGDVKSDKNKPIEATVNATKSPKTLTQSNSTSAIGRRAVVKNTTIGAVTKMLYTKQTNKHVVSKDAVTAIEKDKDGNQLLQQNYQVDEVVNEDDGIDDDTDVHRVQEDEFIQDIDRMNNNELQINMAKDHQQ